jgi:micrococcal nuclease
MKTLLKIILTVCCLVPAGLSQAEESNFSLFFKNSSQYEDVIVDQVVSADTIILESGERIKLIGLKAPQKPRKEVEYDDEGKPIIEPVRPDDPIEEKAINFVRALLLKKHVRLEFDDQKKTDDHATYAYVYLLKDKMFVNTEILRQGLANLQIVPPNFKYEEELRAAYREARKEGRGLQGQ